MKPVELSWILSALLSRCRTIRSLDEVIDFVSLPEQIGFSVMSSHAYNQLISLLSRLIPAFVLALLMGSVGVATAQPGFGENSPVNVSIEASAPQVVPGDQVVFAITLDHDEHYHSNLNVPVVPPEMGDFLPVPTTLKLPQIKGWTFGPIHWPEPTEVPVDFFFTGNPIKYLVYTEKAVIYVSAMIAEGTGFTEQAVDFTLTYQACDETTCLPPTAVKLTSTVSVVGSIAQTDPDPTPAIFDGYTPSTAGDTSSDSAALSTGDFVQIERKFLGLFVIPSSDSLAGMVALALSAAIGGFILNLTPCVLPVIPIKVMTISSHAGESKSRAFMLSMWMAIGVITFWVGIGIPVAFVSKFTDPSIIFGIWWITGIIGVVIVVMSFGIMGLFQIKLPQKVYLVNPKADSASGSFIFGVMTAVLGLPCFGFVAGALLAGAATMPAFLVLTVFAFMGIGMAMPYVVLAMFPKLIEKLPRTGPASELIKHVMGLLMLAAGAYFLGTSMISFGSGNSWVFPWWGKAIHWWAIGIVGVTAGGWLIIQTFKITKRIVPRLTYTTLGLVFATTGSFVAYNQTMHQYHYFWQPFTPEFLAKSLDSGKVVVLDFTAEWCLNCKALEASVLARNPVKAQLLSGDVIPMVADLTSTSAPGWKHLNETLGQTGIPFLVVYAPGIDDPIWVSNAYTSSQVVDAINEARRRGAAISLVD